MWLREERLEKIGRAIAELRKMNEEQRKIDEEQSKVITEPRESHEELKRPDQVLRDDPGCLLALVTLSLVTDPTIFPSMKADSTLLALRLSQTLEFADTWPGVVLARNTAVHEVSGDKVISVLRYCEGNLRCVLQRVFRSLWGISPSDWHNSTAAQRALTFRNSSDCELGLLG
ncbi:hypothetical protein HOY80DRAFT_1088483 [Tuber brumale]|nr:hypothetical protein HOY80DRAFT_1088483 [Tuber brumale]